MPTVNFVGELSSCVADVREISVTWAIVPGKQNVNLILLLAATYVHT